MGRTASFGVATVAPSQARQVDTKRLLSQADDGLYRAKQAGRNCVVRFDR